MALEIAAIVTGAASAVTSTAQSVVQGLAGARVADVARDVRARMAGRFALPRNHDLVGGIRTAHLAALDKVARRYEQALRDLPPDLLGDDDQAFASCLRDFLDQRLKALDGDAIDVGKVDSAEVRRVLDQMVYPSDDADFAAQQTTARREAEQAALAEIEDDAGWPAPVRFRQLFHGNGSVGWYDTFSCYVNQQLKDLPRFRDIFVATELVDTKRLIAAAEARVAELIARGVERLDIAIGEFRRENQEGHATIQAAIAHNQSTLREILDHVTNLGAAREAGIQMKAVIELAQRITEDVQDFDQALIELTRAVEVAIKVAEEGARGSNADDFVDHVLARVAEISASGDYDAATAEVDAAIADWEEREAERQAAARQAGLSLLRAGLNQDLLRRDPFAAALRVSRMVGLEHDDDPEVRFQALRAEQNAFYVRGRDRGVNLDLEVSIEIARLLLAGARDPGESATARIVLGNALLSQGERTAGQHGADLLAQAVTAYRAALTVYTETEHPLDWAMTQNNLGISLSRQGERTAGQHGADLLAQAVTAYRAALTVYTETEHPLDWAMTQNNLGISLSRQGERTAGQHGADLLAQAVTAFRAALSVYTETEHPLDWAMTQNNLGLALRSQGERTAGLHGADLLAQAVTAFRAALSVRTETEHPLQWAMTQNNLGLALSSQGERTAGQHGADLLAQAVTASRAALTVYTETEHPLQWAMTQNNLGLALSSQGERTAGQHGADLLAQAVTAFRAALSVRTETEHPLDWAMTQNNLGLALSSQGERTAGQHGADLLAQAVTASRAALTVYTETEHPLQWAMTQNNLGLALSSQGERTAGQHGADLLAQAVTAFRAALSVRTETEHPLDWAMTQNNLGLALSSQGERTAGQHGADLLAQAVTAFRAALSVYTEDHHPLEWEKVQRNLRAVLGENEP